MGILRLNEMDSANRLVTQKICVLASIAICILSLLFGFLVTYFVMRDGGRIDQGHQLSAEFVRSHLINSVSTVQIETHLRELTKKPQLAGSSVDAEMANYVANQWRSNGIDTHLVTYNVLLSYPDPSQPNQVKRLGQTPYSSNLTEAPLNAIPDEVPYYTSNPPFLAYTTKGDVTGQLVYVNYGQVADYDALRAANVNVNGTIAIARFGAIFRGNILKFAQENGAIGLIIYSDPADYTNGSAAGVYPDSVFMPGTGAQRGTTWILDGDPLTPFYPAIDSAYRIDESDAPLPTIPGHCIGYNDARYILDGLTGSSASSIFSNFTSGIPDITINVGPGYINGDTIELSVTTNRTSRAINNVIGVIKGCVEPDRYVLVGNHRDSWTFGSVDPSSGTAALLALTKAIHDVHVSYNWCPRRSIVFCSWGAEEYGLIGSTEWVEDNQKTLLSQAVAYLNVDSAVTGNYTLSPRATPLLYKPIWEAAKYVPNPDPDEVANNRKTVYDTWLHRMYAQFNNTTVAQVLAPGGGSDHVPFLQITGVPVVDFRYRCELDVTCNPNYHTMYETFFLQNNLMDRGFYFNRAVTQVWIELIRSLADTPVLPLSIEYYPILLNDSVAALLKQYNQTFADQNITLVDLKAAVTDFSAAVNGFTEELAKVDTNNELQIRQFNDRLMLVERAFLDDKGLPLRAQHKHVLLAPSSLNSYAGAAFPGVYDLMWQYSHAVSHGWSNATEIMEDVKQHLSVITFYVDAAAQFVRQRLY